MKSVAICVATGVWICLGAAVAAAQSSTQRPEDYIDQLSKCAGGLKISVSGELLGSIKEIYAGKRTAGQDFRFDSVGQFLALIPEKDRLEAYKLYVGCISNRTGATVGQFLIGNSPTARTIRL